ncbi:MAG: DUF2442 domain-containing protein [Planctomycetes bacterium]|nr:DUF2442 domain-containing protein [Planctomycetota bacterium]
MNISANNPSASRVWFDANSLWLELRDGRQLSVPLAYFPRLQNATVKQRAKFEMSGGGTGLHWDDLDEDISVAGLLAGRGDQTRSAASPPVKSKSKRNSNGMTRRKRRVG